MDGFHEICGSRRVLGSCDSSVAQVDRRWPGPVAGSRPMHFPLKWSIGVSHAASDLDGRTETFIRLRRRRPRTMTVVVALLLLVPPLAFLLGTMDGDHRGTAGPSHHPSPTPTPSATVVVSAVATAGATAAATAVATIIERPVPAPSAPAGRSAAPSPTSQAPVQPVHTTAPPASQAPPPSPSPSPSRSRKCVVNLLGICV